MYVECPTGWKLEYDECKLDDWLIIVSICLNLCQQGWCQGSCEHRWLGQNLLYSIPWRSKCCWGLRRIYEPPRSEEWRKRWFFSRWLRCQCQVWCRISFREPKIRHYYQDSLWLTEESDLQSRWWAESLMECQLLPWKQVWAIVDLQKLLFYGQCRHRYKGR